MEKKMVIILLKNSGCLFLLSRNGWLVHQHCVCPCQRSDAEGFNIFNFFFLTLSLWTLVVAFLVPLVLQVLFSFGKRKGFFPISWEGARLKKVFSRSPKLNWARVKLGCCIFFSILLKSSFQRQEKIAFASFTSSFKAEDTTKRNIYSKYMLGSMETVKLEGSYVSGIFLHYTSFPPFWSGRAGSLLQPNFQMEKSRQWEAGSFCPALRDGSCLQAPTSPPLIGECSRLGWEPGKKALPAWADTSPSARPGSLQLCSHTHRQAGEEQGKPR